LSSFLFKQSAFAEAPYLTDAAEQKGEIDAALKIGSEEEQ